MSPLQRAQRTMQRYEKLITFAPFQSVLGLQAALVSFTSQKREGEAFY